MTVSYRQRKAVLEKRLKRFFFSEIDSRRDFQLFLSRLKDQVDHDIFIFGGLIRDIYIQGVKKFYSDIDVVVDCEVSDLEKFLNFQSGLTYTKNKFGGFRVHFFPWDLDIWCVKDTWAFKQGLVIYQHPNDLLNTTLLNWDSVIFNIRTRRLMCGDDYFSDMDDGLLKIVLKNNPNEVGALVRIFRAIRSKYVKTIDFSVIQFISEKLDFYRPSDIVAYERVSYYKRYLIESDIEDVYAVIRKDKDLGLLNFTTANQLILNFD